MSLVRFLLYYLLFLLLIGGSILFMQQQWPMLISKNIWIGFIFLVGITFMAYLIAHFGLKMSAEYSVMALLSSIVIKLLFSMVFVLIYRLKTPQTDRAFMFNFFSLYLLFSAFEIYSLLRNLRLQNKK